MACPAGTTNAAADDASGDDTVCDATLCGENEFVFEHGCVACPAGTTNAAADDASGVDTRCQPQICAVDEYVSANTCVACPVGMIRPAGDDATGVDTQCEALLCAVDEYVSANTCADCPPGSVNERGDDATGPDTECESVLCGMNESVTDHRCVPCAQGFAHPAGDDASGGDTVCSDIDECADDNGGCEQGCENRDGGYACLCEDGLRPLGMRCVRTNECLLGTDDCHENARCENTAESFTCACLAGYEGDGRDCADVDECADATLNHCVGRAQCRNTVGGYTCECPEGMIPFEGGCIIRNYCDQPTQWSVIGDALADYGELLPTVPAVPLAVDWPTVPVFREDWLTSAAFYEPLSLETGTCALPDIWDAERIQVGPELTSHPVPDWFDYAGGEPYCRGDVYSDTSSDIRFTQRWPRANRAAVSNEPGWLRMRFPIPPGHQVRSLTYRLSGAVLRGSHPDTCHPNDRDPETQECAVRRLADGLSWDDEVPPGLFILWGAPELCDRWLITGPHRPNDYSWGSEHTVAVPDELQNVDELVATLLVYRQHFGCNQEDSLCYDMTSHRDHFNFEHAFIKTEGTFDFGGINPPNEHPRLFGTDEEWMADLDRFIDLDCTHGIAPKGGIPDVKNTWMQFAYGYKGCREEPLARIDDHPDVQRFKDGGQIANYKADSSLRVLHLIRRVRACHRLGREGCQFPLEDVERVADEFIAHELARFDQWGWTQWSFGFDIRSAPPFLFWNLFIDILGDRLNDEQLALIRAPLNAGIDAYLQLYEERHWAIFNGNNWTTSLSFSAVIWSITHWHEDLRAQRVLDIALKTLARHMPYQLADGTYQEGVSYASHAFSDLYRTNRLVLSAFGTSIPTIDWSVFPKQADWLLRMVLTDAATVDFSDAWKQSGWTNYNVLYMLSMGDDGEPIDVDPCSARRFFTNLYYGGGMQHLWGIDPLVAQDWEAVTAQCPVEAREAPEDTVSIWPVGGYGLLRSDQVGRTEVAQLDPDAGSVSRYQQADQTHLAVSAIPNRYAHTELDFGSVIWAAYGHRLLTDMGYGTLTSNRYYTEPDYAPDNNPTGHNTLVVSDARHPTRKTDTTNTSQLNGIDGQIAVRDVDGYRWIELDGSALYGAHPPQLGGYKPQYLDDEQPPGWLRSFHRHLMPLEGGHYLLVDTFHVREDVGTSAVHEHWHVRQVDTPPNPEACAQSNRSYVNFEMNGPSEVQLTAVCSLLDKGRLAESVGRIHGLSLHPGGFIDAGDVTFTNRIRQPEQFRRFKWVSEEAQAEGIRLFVLASSTDAATLPEVNMNWVDCPQDHCAQIEVDAAVLRLNFQSQDHGWVLTPDRVN